MTVASVKDGYLYDMPIVVQRLDNREAIPAALTRLVLTSTGRTTVAARTDLIQFVAIGIEAG
jgi:hypothetical protein